MKIIEQSKDRLVVRHCPWVLAGVMALMGAAAFYHVIFDADSFHNLAERRLVAGLGAVCLMVVWWFAPVVKLEFDRRAGRVLFRESRLFRTTARAFDLNRIGRAQIERNQRGIGSLTRLVIRTLDGVTLLDTGFSSFNRTKAMAEINDWLEGKTASQPQQPTVRR